MSQNHLVDWRSESLKDLDLQHQKEHANTDDCPGIESFDPNTGAAEELDVSLAQPWSKEMVKKLPKNKVTLLNNERRRTQLSTSNEVLPQDSTSLCLPLIIENFTL